HIDRSSPPCAPPSPTPRSSDLRTHRPPRGGRLPYIWGQRGRPGRPPARYAVRPTAGRTSAADRGRADEGRDPRAVARARAADVGQAVVRVPLLTLPVRRPDHLGEAAPGRCGRGVHSLARLPPVPRPPPRPAGAARDSPRRDRAGLGWRAPRRDRAAIP